MSGDDDLAKLLPEAPPRPDRREAAIAEALRRFDGGAAGPPAKRPVRWLLPSWPKLGRAQMGAVMSMALVAVIGVPLALVALREESAQVSPQEPASTEQAPVISRPSPNAPPPRPEPVPESQGPASAAVQAQPQMAPPPAADAEASGSAVNGAPQESDRVARAEPGASLAQQQARSEAVAPAPAAPPPPPPPPPPSAPPAPLAQQRGALAEVMARRTRDFAANTPTVAAKAAEDRTNESIVVTGSRITRPALAWRGDWNACTVNDPSRSLEGCRRLVDPAAKGTAGRAAARVADGLARAWQGDMDGAVAAFGAAIEIDPRMAFAYLNRGLAYQRNGETGRAIADFNQAVRHAPSQARGYYHRSVALREAGDARRAAADETRAVDLDSRYEALFD